MTDIEQIATKIADCECCGAPHIMRWNDEYVSALQLENEAFKQNTTPPLPPQTDALKIAREALRNIQIEAEREQGSWVHLKRVIALNCKQTLAALEQSK